MVRTKSHAEPPLAKGFDAGTIGCHQIRSAGQRKIGRLSWKDAFVGSGIHQEISSGTTIQDGNGDS